MCHTAYPLCPISPTYHKVSIAMSHGCGSKPLVSGPSSSWDTHQVSSQTSYGYPKSQRSYSYWWWWGRGSALPLPFPGRGRTSSPGVREGQSWFSRTLRTQHAWFLWLPVVTCMDISLDPGWCWATDPDVFPDRSPGSDVKPWSLGASTSHSDQAKHYSWWGPMFRYKRPKVQLQRSPRSKVSIGTCPHISCASLKD